MKRRGFLTGLCCCSVTGSTLSLRADDDRRSGFICASTYRPPTDLNIATFSSTEKQRTILSRYDVTTFGVSMAADRWRKEHSLTAGSKITLGVYYLDGSTSDQEFVTDVAKGWLTGGLEELIDFEFNAPQEKAHIRVSIEAFSNSSKIGPEAHLRVPNHKPTMKLFDRNNPWAIEHEFGHALGLQHEHQFPGSISFNEDAVVEDLEGQMTVAQIYKNVIDAFATQYKCVGDPSFNDKSVMMYEIPSRWTNDGTSYSGGNIISERDIACLHSIYSL